MESLKPYSSFALTSALWPCRSSALQLAVASARQPEQPTTGPGRPMDRRTGHQKRALLAIPADGTWAQNQPGIVGTASGPATGGAAAQEVGEEGRGGHF